MGPNQRIHNNKKGTSAPKKNVHNLQTRTEKKCA